MYPNKTEIKERMNYIEKTLNPLYEEKFTIQNKISELEQERNVLIGIRDLNVKI